MRTSSAMKSETHDDGIRRARDELRDAEVDLLLRPHGSALRAPVGVGDDGVAQVGDPAGAGRALHGGADEMDRVRRRGRDHDVDLVLANEPNRGGDGGEVPRDVLVGDERAAAEQPRLGGEPCEALLAVELLGRLAADRAEVARPVHPRLRRHAQRLVTMDPLRVVGGEHVRLDPERGKVLGQLQGTLHSSTAGRGKVEADEQHLHPGDGTGGSFLVRVRVASRCTSRIAITPPTSAVGMYQTACIRSEKAIATSPWTPTTPSAETASHW